MKRSRSCAILLAAAVAAVCPLMLAVETAPTTQPASPATQPAPAATQPLPATTAAVEAQPATTQSAATQTASTQPATTQAATQAGATVPSTTQFSGTEPATSPTTMQAGTNPAPGTQLATTSPATTQLAATQPSLVTLNFKDMPLDIILERLSHDDGFSIVKEAPVDVRVTLWSIQPVSPERAVEMLNEQLAANGLTAIEHDHTLRIVPLEKAKKGNLPVHYGADPLTIPATNELITQVIPTHNVDAVKLRQDLTPLIGPDADVTANAGANAIVMTDTSANVKRIVEIIAVLDKREGTTSEVKIIALKNANAAAAAKLVLAIFRPEEPASRLKGDAAAAAAAAAAQKPQGMLLGTGVDQALHGGKVTAAADERTNSVVVAGPAESIKSIESMLKEIDENPATAAMPTMKTFHLKNADAAPVAKAVRVLFAQNEDGQPGQSQKIATDESVHAHVVVVFEERTNTVIITAPPAAMAIAERLISDIDDHPTSTATVHSYPLKFADAATTAKVVLAVFTDPDSPRSSRVAAGAREKVTVASDQRTNTLFVTAPQEAIELVDKTVHDLDASPTSGAIVKFYRLKQGDAESTAKLIINFFRTPESGQPPGKPVVDSVHYGVNAVADPRTNTVAVTAPQEAMKTVDQMIKEVETEPSTAFEIESFTMKNADATSVAKLLTTVFQPDQSASPASGTKANSKEIAVKVKIAAAADDRTNTVVVTAPADTIKVIEGIVKLLDAPPVMGAEIQVFTLKYADPLLAGKLLESIFQPPSLQAVGGSGSSASNSIKPPGAVDAIRKLGWISTTADQRTNTLIVTASPEVLKAVTGIVKQLDSNPASQQTVFIYRLRNAQSQNLQIVLNQLFSGNATGAAGAGAGTASNTLGTQTQQRPGSQLGTSSGLGLGSTSGTSGFGLGSTSTQGGGTGIGARRGTVTSGTPTLGTGTAGGLPTLSAGNSRTLNELAGQVYVVADPDTNSLLVTTNTRFLREVRDIIAELDRPVPQVLIKVLVAEVTHDNSADWGTDFSILNRRANGNGTMIGQALGNAAAASNGGLVVSLVENNINVTLHALAIENKLDVLSRPYILASDNQLASITVGQEVPFITNTQITEAGQQINTIQYQDVGIILNVTPHINPEGLVILDVAPEISQLTGSTVPISNNVAAPIIAKRSAQSRVGIRNGQTIVIGGLMQDQKTLTINKVPILGDIPFIGEAFRRTQIDKTKTELLIFLTPHVAQQPDTLSPMTADEMNGTRLTPNAVGPHIFYEHMQGMQRGSIPDTQSTTRPVDPVKEFSQPASKPAEQSGPTTTGPIRLP
jgi:general secretion pathway protein D